MPKGIYPKYVVFKHPEFIPEDLVAQAFGAHLDLDSSVDLDLVEDFVFALVPEKDHHARVALAAYAESVRPYQSALADDIDTVLGGLSPIARMNPT